MSVKVFDQDARDAFSAAIRDGATTLGTSLKEALHTLNSDSLHQSSVDAAKQLGDSIGNGMIELADKFYWPIVLLLLSISAFFIASAVYCAVKAMRHKQTTLYGAGRKGYEPLLNSDTQLPGSTFREDYEPVLRAPLVHVRDA